ncbi:G patch domain-containing protein 4-like isoform X2 [Daphnia carinata]|uniref:G patch domain-containing protein 4-like isoform X2 n=1 Tax=Daphnia carinata TaxID=120202 RepID=UPI00257F4326|nr:G patch domain-containing protein 4-like isoform X2 [Daphnia carinata]
MAMLAEPKRKKKWSLNPRGKLWCNDDTKIGQKLLEKMGWAKGKGLGREEQGDLEPIRLKYKNDSEGVGFEVKNDQWIAHREEFNSILEALNGKNNVLDETDTTSTQSLESRSKNSKARVHYHKFTRGKDLSRYSAEDMACILGKRANCNAEAQEEKDIKIKEEPAKESTIGSVEHMHGVTTIQRGSIQEYFESKMAAVKEKQRKLVDCKQVDSGHEGSSNSDEGGKEEKRVRINEDLNVVKEFRSKEKILKTEKMNPKDDAVMNETSEDVSPKKKKKGFKTKVEAESADLPSKPLPVTEEMVDNFEVKKKKKKKFEKEIPEPVVDIEPAKSKKLKKSKIEEITAPTVEIIVNSEGDQTQDEPKKKKKKAKKQEEEAVECEQRIHKVEEEQTQEEPKKKKKKSKKQEEAMETSNFEEIEPVQKKSKKNKTVEESVEQVQNEEDVQPPIKKKKKNKKDEQEAIEKYTKLDDSSVESVQAVQITAGENKQNGLEQDVEQEPKKKKKKKSKQTEEEALETFHKTENSLETTETKRNKKDKTKPSDEIEVESMKKNKGTTIEAPKVQDKTNEDAQINPAKGKSAKKRKACEMTDETVVNDQLAGQTEVKPDDCGKEIDRTQTKHISAIIIEAGAACDRRKLESIQLNDGSRLSQKLNRRLMRAKFDKFVGSNILTITGYGSDGNSLM